MATELHALLRHLQLAPPYILVGHSLGGMIIQYYAAYYPRSVAGMVLVDPALAQFYLRADSLPAWREELEKERRDLAAVSPTIRAEMAAFEADISVVAGLRPLPAVPTVLLTSIHHEVPGRGGPALEALWLEVHEGWAAAHPGTRQVVDSLHGHRLQEETPGAVVTAVHSVLAQIRTTHRP